MGGGTYSSVNYWGAVNSLKATGMSFARSATAARTRDFTKIADILNPRKLKNGMRESCFAPGANDLLAIVIAIDGTGSMQEVPSHVQAHLPELMELVVDKGITDHPNIEFMCFDDERATPPDGVFQMSQFEIEAMKLVESLNEMIIPGAGGGNRGEAYHLAFYAAAQHTRLEAFERDGAKGFFVMICDEEPYYDNEDPATHGTLPAVAKEVFGDTIQSEVPMLESVKKTAERYHVLIIRPGHTSHGQNKSITREWQALLTAAGENSQNVLEVPDTEAIMSTIAMAIGRISGFEETELVEALTAKGASGLAMAGEATKGLIAADSGRSLAKVSAPLATGKTTGRERL